MSTSAISESPPSKSITSLAIIKVNWDDKKDHIASFVPLVAHCLLNAKADEISLLDLQGSIREYFGLRVPQYALKTVLKRAKKDGLVKIEHDVYRRELAALQSCDLSSARQKVICQHENIVSRLVEFSNSIHGRDWSKTEAEEALLGYIETLAAPILQGLASGEESLVEFQNSPAHGSAVVSDFIVSLMNDEPETLTYLETVVKGTMLANVLYVPEIFKGGKVHLDSMVFYLDTPFLVRALGYTSKEIKEPCVELLHLLQQQGATIKAFSHTIKELEDVLHAAADSYRKGGNSRARPGTVGDFFVQQRLQQSDVDLMIAKKGDKLDELKIIVEDAPEHTENLGLDESKLEQRLEEGIRYWRRGPRELDADSLTAIYRLRNGQLCRDLQTCHAALITTNSALVNVSLDYFNEEFGEKGAPLCVLDSPLTALVWLMNPSQVDDLPRKQIIATSYVTLNVSNEVWRKYLEEIDRLKEEGEFTEEDIALATSTYAAHKELMRHTIDDTAYAEGTAVQILERARQVERADVQQKLELSTEKHDEERKRRVQAEEATKQERSRTKMMEREAEDAKDAHLARLEDVKEAHLARLEDVASLMASIVSWAMFVLLAVLVVIGTALTTKGLLPSDWSNSIPWILTIAASPIVVITFGLVLLNTIFDLSLPDLRSKIQRLLKKWLYKVISRIFSPS